MTPEQIRLLKSSYAKVDAITDQAAALFYERLFAMAPAVRPLFHNNMKTQGRMLISTIGLVIRNIDHPERISDMVNKLGQRHQHYGARPEHYPVVGQALLWTLRQGLGAEFTAAHESAWGEAYELLSGLMIQAQQKAA